jgi:hypothetical protein
MLWLAKDIAPIAAAVVAAAAVDVVAALAGRL